MSEPTIKCPYCKREIRLTEAMAGPLLEQTRAEYEAREREARERAAAELRAAQVKATAEAERKAKAAAAEELAVAEREAVELRRTLEALEGKLAEAQRAQAEAEKAKRELAEQKRELDLTVERRISEGTAAIRASARTEAEEAQRLKLAERDQLVATMTRQVEDLQRRLEQGSQQAQGEVLELELENLLRATFVHDEVQPVPKGEFGGDVLQHVVAPGGVPAGAILWEFKRTKNWTEGWLAKLRDDARAAKADIMILLSQTMPEGIADFGLRGGVWVARPDLAAPIGSVVRAGMIEAALARVANQGLGTKAELLYSYLTGPRFRTRVQALAESYTAMREDLDRERKAIVKQWAKREELIERMLQATAGMFGEVQGIAGSSVPEVAGLDLKQLTQKGSAS